MNIKNNIFDQCAEKFQSCGMWGAGLRVGEFRSVGLFVAS